MITQESFSKKVMRGFGARDKWRRKRLLYKRKRRDKSSYVRRFKPPPRVALKAGKVMKFSTRFFSLHKKPDWKISCARQRKMGGAREERAAHLALAAEWDFFPFLPAAGKR